MGPDALIERLLEAGALPARPESVTPMAGGYSNRAWRLSLPGQSLLLKAFTGPADNPLFPNLPDHEAAALRGLAGLGVAPEFVAVLPADPPPAALLYRWVEGAPWRAGTAAVARLLGRVHAAPAPEGLRRLPTEPEAVLAAGDGLLARASPARRRLLEGLRPRPKPAAAPARAALVHTDVGPGNLIDGPDGLRLIDWQCPGLGDPAEDLASFLSPGILRLYGRPPHDAAEAGAFLAAYPDRDATARLKANGAVWRWRLAAYCLWRAEALAETRPEAARAYAEAFALERALLEAEA